jgi:lipoyl(octanoyl) transferase
VAINVNPELRDFDVIVPCGIVDCEMTSLQREVGRGPPLEEVEKLFQKKVAEEFS